MLTFAWTTVGSSVTFAGEFRQSAESLVHQGKDAAGPIKTTREF